MLRGLDPWRHRLLDRKTPHVERRKPDNRTGAILKPDPSRIAANRCHYNRGGYMTLAQFGVAFWHDLAAPVIAGIITAAVVSWWRNRK
ncbi:toxic polypeptide, small [Kluyvera genomosp. 3]|uniref:Toxic polypeptide, small n=1 Tax=Kluyvera genomosp. 3 TaxID=2774055 RepID=A0A248KIX9_9ENTR|nr:toxic polypeptide, small [Kluyvera genomosp. 3]